jgi:hypothetical protein
MLDEVWAFKCLAQHSCTVCHTFQVAFIPQKKKKNNTRYTHHEKIFHFYWQSDFTNNAIEARSDF